MSAVGLEATYRRLLNDTTFPDLTVVVGKDKLTAHRFIMGLRCPDLFQFPDFSDPKKMKKIKDKEEIKIKDGLPDQLTASRMLEFLYTSTVQFPKLEPENTLRLYKAAKHFKQELLVYTIESHMVEQFSAATIFDILKATHEMKEQRMKEFAMKWSMEHYNDFITNKDGLKILGIDLFQEVVTAFQVNKDQFNGVVLPAKPANTLVQDYKKLYEMMPFSDCKWKVSGEDIPCHRAVLSAKSDRFAAVFKDPPPTGFELKLLSTNAFRSMLKFIYYGDESIDPLPACELIPLCHQYALPDLLEVCENIIRNNVGVPTVLPILEVAYLPDVMATRQELVAELKSKCLPFILNHLGEIQMQSLRTMHPFIAMDVLLHIQDFQRKNRGGGGGKRR